MIEIKEKRTPYEKHFLKENGNMEVQLFKDKIHYLKNGKYEEISNQLKETHDAWENIENDLIVTFYKTNGAIKYEKDNFYLKITPKNINSVSSLLIENAKEKSKVFYSNIFDNVDLEYILSFKGIKENLIVKDKIKVHGIEYDVESNLTLTIKNNLLIAKHDNENIFSFAVPYMQDKSGEQCYDVSYVLQKESNKYTLTLSYDEKWINSDDRTFPIIIDPSLITNDRGVDDTYIYAGDTNDVRYNRDYIIAGVQKVNNQDRINRALLRFVLPNVGTSDEVIGAELRLFGYEAVGEVRPLTEQEKAENTEKLVSVHEITKDWTLENANWNSMSGAYNAKIENNAYVTRSYIDDDLKPVLKSSKNRCLITDLVKKWYTGSPNHGIMIKQENEQYINSMTPMFFSSNYGEGSLTPMLIIEYRNQNGLESYMDYIPQSFIKGDSYVNTFNGNLTALFSLSCTIGIFPASVAIVYNTNDVILNNNTVFGKGYKLTYDQTLSKINIGETEKIRYLDEDGTVHYFNFLDGEYVDEDGLNLKITLNNDSYVMKDKIGNSKTFVKHDDYYWLKQIKGISGKEINILRNSDNNITKITDGQNNEINITYENNKITFVSPIETTTLNYENHNLKSIVTKEGVTTFEYDSNNVVVKITDVNGLSTEYEYYDGIVKKIHKVTRCGVDGEKGEIITLEYGVLNTRIKNQEDKIMTNIYNSYGNLISSNTMASGTNLKDAYSLSSTFGTEESNLNKLISSTIPIKFSKNYFPMTNYDNINHIFGLSIDTILSSDRGGFDGISAVCFKNKEENGFIEYYSPIGENEQLTVSMYIKTEGRVRVQFYSIFASGIFYEKIIENTGNFEKIAFVSDGVNSFCFQIRNEIPNAATYVGDIQIEKGDALSTYNAIENPDFEDDLDGWNLSVCDVDSGITKDINDTFEVVEIDEFKNKALKLDMLPNNVTDIVKKIDVSGLDNDMYYLGFWYKNIGLETSNQSSQTFDDSFIENAIGVLYGSESEEKKEYCAIPHQLNVNAEAWQYFSIPFIMKEKYKSLEVHLQQKRQSGTLYVTNFSLYKQLKTRQYEYDKNGNVVKVKDVDESNVFDFNQDNALISGTNPRGKHFKLEYDKRYPERLIRAISSSGISNKIVYNEAGNPVEVKVSKDYNVEINSGYYKIRQRGTNDYLKIEGNNLISKSDYCSNTVFKVEKIDNTYKISDTVISSKYLVELNNRIVLDTHGNNQFKLEQNKNASYHIYIEDESGNKKYLKRDEYSFVFVSEYPDLEENYLYEYYFEDSSRLFLQKQATYTEDGRFLTSVTDTLLNKLQYVVNETTGLTTKVINSNGAETNYSYNEKNQLVEIQQGDKITIFKHNDHNLLSEVINGTKKYKLIYNNFLNLTNIQLNDNNLLTRVYDSRGKLISVVYGNNHKINYNYDEYNRIKNVIKGNYEYDYLYNNNGNIHSIIKKDSTEIFPKNPDDKIYYIYDADNRVTQQTYLTSYYTTYIDEYQNVNYVYHDINFIIDNSYDDDSNIIKKVFTLFEKCKEQYPYWEQHAIENKFDREGIILESCIDKNINVNYTYDELARMTSKKINNKYEMKYDYVSIGNRTSLLVKNMISGNDKYSYKYDKINNITDIYLNDKLTNHYDYDIYGQLIKDSNYRNNIITEYNYDTKGNILSKIKKNMDTNKNLMSDEYEYNDSMWEDLLTKFNNETITYDTIGNPLTIGNKKLSWSNGRELSSYEYDKVKVQYKYSLNGIRTEKIINDVKTSYYTQGSDIVYEKTGDDIIYYLYDDIGLLGLNYNGTTYYYVKNLQGDIIEILDSNYKTVVSYEYSSYGEVISVRDSSGKDITDPHHIGLINPFRYKGYYYDSETKMYYLNNRYYNPQWGRFINSDKIIFVDNSLWSCNLFCYCANCPINIIDSNGDSFFNLFRSPKVQDLKMKIVVAAESIIKFTDGVSLAGKRALAWIGATTASVFAHWNSAADLLSHSLQDNPPNLTFGQNDKLVQDILKSNTFKNTVKNAVQSEPNAVWENKELKVTFPYKEEPNLFLAIHEVTFYMNGTLTNGQGNISFHAVDTYDFGEKDKFKGWAYRLNLLGITYQNNGWLNNYYIELDFDYYVNS